MDCTWNHHITYEMVTARDAIGSGGSGGTMCFIANMSTP